MLAPRQWPPVENCFNPCPLTLKNVEIVQSYEGVPVVWRDAGIDGDLQARRSAPPRVSNELARLASWQEGSTQFGNTFFLDELRYKKKLAAKYSVFRNIVRDFCLANWEFVRILFFQVKTM